MELDGLSTSYLPIDPYTGPTHLYFWECVHRVLVAAWQVSIFWRQVPWQSAYFLASAFLHLFIIFVGYQLYTYRNIPHWIQPSGMYGVLKKTTDLDCP